MADLDLDDDELAAFESLAPEMARHFGMHTAARVYALVPEVRRLRAVEEWARDADHHPGCSGGYGPEYRCKCGRRDLFTERWAEADG